MEFCPECGSGWVVKNGRRGGRQHYRCKRTDCGFQFVERDRPISSRFPGQVIARSLELYTCGLSYQQAASQVQKEFSITETDINRATVQRWVARFLPTVVAAIDGLTTSTTGIWCVEWTPLPRIEAWCWSVVDLDSGYILAARIGAPPDAAAARGLVREARSSTRNGGYCFTVQPDPCPTQEQSAVVSQIIEALREEFPPDAYVPPEELPEGTSTLFGHDGHFQKIVNKVQNRKAHRNAASRDDYLDTLVIAHNFCTHPNDLNGLTPAQVADVAAPFTTWEEAVRHVAALQERQRKQEMELQEDCRFPLSS